MHIECQCLIPRSAGLVKLECLQHSSSKSNPLWLRIVGLISLALTISRFERSFDRMEGRKISAFLLPGPKRYITTLFPLPTLGIEMRICPTLVPCLLDCTFAFQLGLEIPFAHQLWSLNFLGS